jgi:hypothetical protein
MLAEWSHSKNIHRQHVLTRSMGWHTMNEIQIEPTAHEHGVSDIDMLHAVRHHWRAFATDDPEVTMFIGPSRSGEPLEVGVVVDEAGVGIIHAMPARPKFLKGWWTK